MLLKTFELGLSCFPVIELVVATSLEVDSDDRVRVLGEVGVKYFEGDVVVVQFIVAKPNVDIERVVVPVVDEKPLVYLSGVLEVVPQVYSWGCPLQCRAAMHSRSGTLSLSF